MSAFLIVSMMTNDRPGLVETLSRIVKEHEGNWLESRMSHLAGKFAGIVHVQVNSGKKDALKTALTQLKAHGWIITIEDSENAQQIEANAKLSIVGNDRPGIVKDVAQALAKLDVNVLELNTRFESAAMTAEALFKTHAEINIPKDLELDVVRDALENISNDLMVEIHTN